NAVEFCDQVANDIPAQILLVMMSKGKKPKRARRTHGDIASDFAAKRQLYEQLAKAVRPLLEQLAAENNIPVALVEHRVKEQESLERKVIRPDKAGKYKDLVDITDLCGLRIVLYTNEDCEAMTKAVRDNFDIDDVNSIIKGANYEDDRFGYLSTHLIA